MTDMKGNVGDGDRKAPRTLQRKHRSQGAAMRESWLERREEAADAYTIQA